MSERLQEFSKFEIEIMSFQILLESKYGWCRCSDFNPNDIEFDKECWNVDFSYLKTPFLHTKCNKLLDISKLTNIILKQ